METSSRRRLPSVEDIAAFRAYAETRLRRPAFTPAVSDAGEFFWLSQASAEAFLASTAHLKNAQGQSAKTVYGYIDASSPNAFADRFGDCAVIGLHVGLIAAVYEFGQFVFTQSAFFPDIGDPGVEANPEPLRDHPPGFWSREEGGRVTATEFQDVMAPMTPIDSNRRHAGLFLAHLMARFAWFHEHFHIINGHVDWLTTARKAGGLVEFIEERGSDPARRPDVIRPIEFDADSAAFHALCRVQLGETENITGLAALSSTLRLRLSLFAAYAMTWLFDAYGRRNGDQGSIHPDPYQRLHNLMRTLASNIAPDLPEVGNINGVALAGFDALRSAIRDLPDGGRIARDFSNTEVQPALDEAGEALDALRLQWAPFQFRE